MCVHTYYTHIHVYIYIYAYIYIYIYVYTNTGHTGLTGRPGRRRTFAITLELRGACQMAMTKMALTMIVIYPPSDNGYRS